jgi:hypothetical protein
MQINPKYLDWRCSLYLCVYKLHINANQSEILGPTVPFVPMSLSIAYQCISIPHSWTDLAVCTYEFINCISMQINPEFLDGRCRLYLWVFELHINANQSQILGSTVQFVPMSFWIAYQCKSIRNTWTDCAVCTYEFINCISMHINPKYLDRLGSL